MFSQPDPQFTQESNSERTVFTIDPHISNSLQHSGTILWLSVETFTTYKSLYSDRKSQI